MYFDGMLVESGGLITLSDETLSRLYTDKYYVEMPALLPVEILGKDSSYKEQAINQYGAKHRTTKGPPLSAM